jgi:transposase
MMREDAMIDVAKKLLKRGISIQAVAEDTGLSESIVRDLKAELDKESEQGTAAVV